MLIYSNYYVNIGTYINKIHRYYNIYLWFSFIDNMVFYKCFVNNRKIISRYKYRLYNIQVKKKKEKKNSINLLATIESIYRKNNILLLEICETLIFLHSKTNTRT